MCPRGARRGWTRRWRCGTTRDRSQLRPPGPVEIPGLAPLREALDAAVGPAQEDLSIAGFSRHEQDVRRLGPQRLRLAPGLCTVALPRATRISFAFRPPSGLDPPVFGAGDDRAQRPAVDGFFEADAVGGVLLLAEAEQAGAERHQR